MNASTLPGDEPIEPTTQLCRTSVLAAMFAVPFCCPPMSLLACVTGAVALRQIRRDSSLHGRGLAWAAIWVGAISAAIFSWLLWTHGLETLWQGADRPVAALMRADTEAMPRHWTGPAADATPESMHAFADPLVLRHGAFLHASNSTSRLTPLQQAGRNPVVTVPITLVFERGQVEADLGLQRYDPDRGGVVMKWRSLRVLEPDLGDPVFPAGEPPPPALPADASPAGPAARPAPPAAAPLR